MNQEFSFRAFAQLSFYRKVNETLIELLALGAWNRIVDLACGTGTGTRLILEKLEVMKGAVLFCIDASAEALREAKAQLLQAKHTLVQFIQGDAEELSRLVGEGVDTVVLCNAIHYMRDKSRVLVEIFKVLKQGGLFAFNTTFFKEAILPESQGFYRSWMRQALRTLKENFHLSPTRGEKVEARIQLSAEDYTHLLSSHGFLPKAQKIERVEVPLEGWLAISQYADFIKGVMPGVPLEQGSFALKHSLQKIFEEQRLPYVPRNWLHQVAVKV